MIKMLFRLVLATSIMLCNARPETAQEPPPVNPFTSTNTQREDAVPGYIELSDSSIHPGQIFLTRDKRLKIADTNLQRQREVPLSAIKQIDCKVKKEWLEKEWKFKELTKDEKMYTGRSYPVREYEHTITLTDGRNISGDLSAIVYVQQYLVETPSPLMEKSGASGSEKKTEQFILNKRNKGEIDQDLHSLLYVKSIKLGKEAYEEGIKKSAGRDAKGKSKSGK
jgi:hypothetical protein